MSLGTGGLGSDGILNGLVHPDLLASLHRAYPATANIQVNTPTKRANGELVDVWANHATLINLPGLLAAAGASERRGAALTVQTATHILDLRSYQPAIEVTHRAVVGGTTYNIVAVVHDSQSTMTRLELEIVNH